MARSRRKSIDAAGVAERADRARAFLRAARQHVGADSSAERAVGVSNAVEAGIAAADAICGHVTGEHAQGDNHAEAIAVLGDALQRATAPRNALARLLDVKSIAQYGSGQVSARLAGENLQRAETLVTAMEDTLAKPPGR